MDVGGGAVGGGGQGSRVHAMSLLGIAMSHFQVVVCNLLALSRQQAILAAVNLPLQMINLNYAAYLPIKKTEDAAQNQTKQRSFYIPAMFAFHSEKRTLFGAASVCAYPYIQHTCNII